MADSLPKLKAQKAVEAVISLVRGSVVSLAHVQDGEAFHFGSATILLTPSGRVAALTAWHVLERAQGEPQQILGPCQPEPLLDVVETIYQCPSVDVGLALLKESASEKLAQYCLPPELIADSRDGTVLKTDTVLLVGFPKQLAEHTRRGNVEDHRLSVIYYNTGIAGQDDKNYSVAFDEAIPNDTASQLSHLGMRPREVFQLRKPLGLSGGAMFRIRKTEQLVWSPRAITRLVGVPHAFTAGRKQLAARLETWRPWLASKLKSL